MPKKPMPVEPPGKEGPSPPPPRAPHLPGGPSGPSSSEPQPNPPPQEGGLPVSQGLQGAAARHPSRRLRNRASFDNELPRSWSGRLER